MDLFSTTFYLLWLFIYTIAMLYNFSKYLKNEST